MRTIRINGQHYQRFCKCGDLKEDPKRSKCNKCRPEVRSIKIQGKYYKRFCKCGNLKENITSKICNECAKVELKPIDPRYYNNEALIKFVEKIKRRNGIASLEDIFVHMITIYNSYGDRTMDTLSVQTQLGLMWQQLNEIYNKLIGEDGEIKIFNELVEKKKYRQDYYQRNKDRIRAYQNKYNDEKRRKTNLENNI